MIKLKNLLTEDVNYILKKSPNAIISKAADLMAGVFRIKFKATRDEKSPPDFEHDVMYVLTSPKNTQYGPASSFANGDWYYIIGDDRKKAERRLVTDVLIYPKRKLVGVDKGKQKWEEIEFLFKTTPKSSGKVGSSDIIKVSDFVSAIDPKAERIPETLGTGATLIKQINDILNNTIVDSPSSDEKEIVVVKKDGSSDDSKKDGSSDDSKKDDSVVIDKKDDEVKKDDKVLKQVTSLEKLSFKTDKGEDKALSKEELLALLPEINKTTPDAETAKVFQQLIMQRVINSKIMVDGKQYTLKEIIPSVKDFANIAKPVDGIWGNKSKAVIRDLNKGFFKVQNSTDVTEQLIDRLLSPIKSESKLLLKSILLELNLREQDFSGFDVSAVTTPTPVTTTKKEVPKTTTSTSTKTVPKTTEPEKAKAPEKTKKSDTATLFGHRRGIDKIAQETGGSIHYSEKLKVYYIDLEIRIVRGPGKMDVDGLLHMRDDGTISATSEGKQIVQGIGSGWSDGGRKLITKTGTYTSKLPAGDAIYDTLFQAIRANAGAWKDKTLNLQIGINRLSFRNLPEQPSLKPKATTTKSTTKTSTKTSTQAQKPAPKRFIQDVAKALNVTASYDSKLKVWWFDATLLLKRSPGAFDQNAFLHVRDDGTIIVKVKGATILQGTGSGWSDGGKRLQAKLFGKTVTEKIYVTKAAAGPAFKVTLLAAIRAISSFWSVTTSIKSGVYRDVLSNK
jgi:hypothetical protein